jgi:hypothetical protein
VYQSCERRRRRRDVTYNARFDQMHLICYRGFVIAVPAPELRPLLSTYTVQRCGKSITPSCVVNVTIIFALLFKSSGVVITSPNSNQQARLLASEQTMGKHFASHRGHITSHDRFDCSLCPACIMLHVIMRRDSGFRSLALE